MPIDVIISPEREVSLAAMKRVAYPSAFDVHEFFDGRALLLGLVLDDKCAVLNTPLRQLSELFPTLRVMVAGGAPGRPYVLLPNPRISFSRAMRCICCWRPMMCRACSKCSARKPPGRKRVLVIGGGNVGLSVARMLESQPQRVRVKVIERDRARAEAAADALERSIVLHGDAMDSDLLEEARISNTDAVVLLTDDDRTNLLAAVRAKSMGARMAISLVNDPGMVSLADAMGVDAYINPRALTVSSILRHIRHGLVRSVYMLGDREAEVIEAKVLGTSQIAGRAVRDIAFPEGALLIGVQRAGKFMKPNSSMVLQEGDLVVIFALTEDVPKVDALLQVSFEHF